MRIIMAAGLGGEAHSWEVKLRTLDALVDDLRRRHPTAPLQAESLHTAATSWLPGLTCKRILLESTNQVWTQ